MTELVIFVGLQASGKSSFYRERFAGSHAHVSKDLMSKHARKKQERQMEELSRLLATGRSAVVDNTNPRVADRAPLIELARKFGARSVAYYFEPQVGESIRRNEARTPRVPKVAIFTSAKKLQPPSFSEGFEQIYNVRLGESGFLVSSIEPAATAQ